MKPGKLIARYEHNYFKGWVVSTKRRGRRWVKYFSDKPFSRYIASWPSPTGARIKASFSLGLYGEAEARRLAIEARRRGIAKILGSRTGKRKRRK